MQDILREVASRLNEEDMSELKLAINIQAWGSPNKLEVDSFSWEELVTVADAVKANFTIVEVHGRKFTSIFRPILTHVNLPGHRAVKA